MPLSIRRSNQVNGPVSPLVCEKMAQYRTRGSVQQQSRTSPEPTVKELWMFQWQFYCLQDSFLDVLESPDILPFHVWDLHPHGSQCCNSTMALQLIIDALVIYFWGIQRQSESKRDIIFPKRIYHRQVKGLRISVSLLKTVVTRNAS